LFRLLSIVYVSKHTTFQKALDLSRGVDYHKIFLEKRARLPILLEIQVSKVLYEDEFTEVTKKRKNQTQLIL
jgi:hypothetical protein